MIWVTLKSATFFEFLMLAITYRIAFTSGEFSDIPLWVIWPVEMKLFWFGTFVGAGLKSFSIVATDAWKKTPNRIRLNAIRNRNLTNESIKLKDSRIFHLLCWMDWTVWVRIHTGSQIINKAIHLMRDNYNWMSL